MQRFELTVTRPIRLLFGIILLSVSIPGLLILGLNLDAPTQKIIIPILLGLFIIGFVYFIAFSKLILSYSNDMISFEWRKKVLFAENEIESINTHEIKTLIVEQGVFIKKIVTKDRVVNINNVRPIKTNHRLFVEKLIESVERNDGRVIDIKQYYQSQGYYDLSFRITIMFLAFSIFLISRLWGVIEFYSLLLLFLPLIAYLRHVKLRIRKKTGGNHAYKK